MNPAKKLPITSLVKVIRGALAKVKTEVDKLRGKGALKTYGRDLIKQAQAAKLGPVIGRDEEIKRVVVILSSSVNDNPVLIGEPGVGKTAIVEGLALRIVKGNVPSNLADVRLIALDTGALVAEAKLKERLKSVLKEVEEAEGKVILFIDDFHLVFGAAYMFEPMLERGQLRLICATTPEEYVEKDAAFERHFQEQVHVAEPSVPDTISILRGLKEKYEGLYGVKIQERAIVVAAQLSSRYFIAGRYLPDKAFVLVDEACANVRVQNLERKRMQLEKDKASKARLVEVRKELDNMRDKLKPKKKMRYEESETENGMLTDTVGPDQIAEVVSRWTGIPVTRLGRSEKERLNCLEERLHERVVGQDQAVTAVVGAVLRSRYGLGRPQQTTGSFLFLGPTGVGKTELAKALAEHLFDDDSLIVRFDMGEYMEQTSVSRLIGARPGYVGQLTEAVRRRPYSVVLFDEVDKAHPWVLFALKRVLDDRSLTDGHGRTVDFTNTVIIMNSNLGDEYLLRGLMGESTMESAREMVMQEVRKHFNPRLLRRLDKIVVFEPLSHDQLRKVCRLQLKAIASRLTKKGIALGVTETALDVILARSYDPAYGARRMKRWLDQRVAPELSKMLTREEINENPTLYIDASLDGKELTYRIEKNGGFVFCCHW